ncbi:hypothetical protein IC235_16575 [Hymenobacter sp. BT664]|uniref:Uncharacterized protein n=1 Tax=Hymenobacter montanus TaxID=2771359 RepID=A0A927BEQ7_9BACT|nr:hypothetical protein [Hymenobacter montanus]MBD2769505.1 hypothetical protein [Hymenobacter montanus]
MEKKIQQDVRFLKAYAGLSTLLLGGLLVSSFTGSETPTTFGEINVERINVVEKDGKLGMIIANHERFPDAVVGGKQVKRSNNSNLGGMLFFNDEGVECGGLSFAGKKVNGKPQAGMNLSFDQYDQDETISLSYGEQGGQRIAGLLIKDRPDAPISENIDELLAVRALPDGAEKTAALNKLRAKGLFGADRIFVGKEPDKTAAVYVCDVKGNPRISLTVEASGQAKLNFLDATGKVTDSYPKTSARPTPARK